VVKGVLQAVTVSAAMAVTASLIWSKVCSTLTKLQCQLLEVAARQLQHKLEQAQQPRSQKMPDKLLDDLKMRMQISSVF
jgi:hypothetical protein